MGYFNLLTLFMAFTGSGYVKSLMTGNQYYYKVQWMGKWRYGAGLLPALFFVSTNHEFREHGNNYEY